MVNAVGLQGPGIDAWIDHDLPALRAAGARVIASLWGRTVDDYAVGASMLRRARGLLVAVEVNVSCPNLHQRSEMFAHHPETTAAAIEAVAGADLGLPILAKLSPNVTDITEIATRGGGSRSQRPHPGQHAHGSRRRRRDPAAGARWRWRRAVGPGHQAGRAARGARRGARDCPVCRSSAPVECAAASTPPR